MHPTGNLYDDPGTPGPEERVTELVARDGARVERIVSTGQATPAGEWYDQADDEFVVLLAGEAGLTFADSGDTHALMPGDWFWIPAHCRHRVAWTSHAPAAVWLAVHVPPAITTLP